MMCVGSELASRSLALKSSWRESFSTGSFFLILKRSHTKQWALNALAISHPFLSHARCQCPGGGQGNFGKPFGGWNANWWHNCRQQRRHRGVVFIQTNYLRGSRSKRRHSESARHSTVRSEQRIIMIISSLFIGSGILHYCIFVLFSLVERSFVSPIFHLT